MPEGDTVYRLARRLGAALDGHALVSGELRVPRFATWSLSGRVVLAHDTHGKHLLTRLSDGLTLHTHLRMSGSWTVTAPGRRLPPRLMHEVRVRLATESGTVANGLRLPVVELVDTCREDTVIGHLGPDPLRADWDAERAVELLGAMPGRPVAAALLDQRCIAGLGNLWANELCFLRGVDPRTPVADVDVAALVTLAARALTVSATGAGTMQVTTGNRRRGEQHWVAGRAHQPCRRCGTPIRVVGEADGPAGRRTWWCPSCQPLSAGERRKS